MRQYRAPVLLLVTFVLVMLTGYLYSPWHKHDPLSRATCPFSGFERGVLEEPAGAVVMAAPASSLLAGSAAEDIRESTPDRPLAGTRAPPFRSSVQTV